MAKLKKSHIRIGLIGMPMSGKTHMISMLPNIFWRYKAIKLRPADDAETKQHIDQANINIIDENQLLVQTRLGNFNYYHFNFVNDQGGLLTKGFNFDMEIVDFSGEHLKKYARSWYEKWLQFCNVLIFLVDGVGLSQGTKLPKKELQQNVRLFKHLQNHIVQPLSAQHSNRNRVLVAFCLTKMDLLGRVTPQPMPNAEELMRKHMLAIHEDVEKIRAEEKSWADIRWYPISSLGYVWDQEQYKRVRNDKGQMVRVSQQVDLADGGSTIRVHSPERIRPENLDRLFLDIAKHAGKYKLSFSDTPPDLSKPFNRANHFKVEEHSKVPKRQVKPPVRKSQPIPTKPPPTKSYFDNDAGQK
ncbi:MAG: hypothetical protein QNK37_15905 [Acidobacteriota bacterium]|nr:hypothetical protein [Acidobacteriota bacterium]